MVDDAESYELRFYSLFDHFYNKAIIYCSWIGMDIINGTVYYENAVNKVEVEKLFSETFNNHHRFILKEIKFHKKQRNDLTNTDNDD